MGWLIAAFSVTAMLYASVGFGGGSTYSALLTLADVDPRILPLISLACNIIVVTGGTIRYAAAGQTDWKRALPLVAISAPLAWAGGFTPISAQTFKLLLGLCLLASGVLLLAQREAEPDSPARGNRWSDLLAAGGLGYLAGLVGIGGGIFLSPFLHFTRWGHARTIAATASVFILVNSLFGLAGQAAKLSDTALLGEATGYWPLALAVLVGGQLGSHAGLRLFSLTMVRRMTAVLVLYAAGQLLWKALG